MYALQLQLHKKITALSAEMPFEYMALRYLFVVIAILIVAYLYLVSASVVNVIAQREASQASAQMESNIGVLGGKYFALSQEVTSARAQMLGLTPLSQSSYVYRLDTVGVVEGSKNAI
jgi:hypothetical protein